MDAVPAFREQSAQHEAAHAVIAYRHGIDVLFGITLHPQMVGCWDRGNRLELGEFAEPPTCAAGPCRQLGGRSDCSDEWLQIYPGSDTNPDTAPPADARALYIGRVPDRGMIVGVKKADPDRARVMAEGVVCSALAAGCFLKHLKCGGHLGTENDEAQALYAAMAVLPESEAKRWVEDLREQTRKEVAEPRNLAVLGEIVRALREAERWTLGPEALRGILRNA